MHTYLLHHLLENCADRYPENEAVVFKNQSIKYSMLEKQSNKLARILYRHGVKVGDRVGIMLGKSIESIISIFGVLKTGACYVPIDPLAPVNRKKYILGNCEVKVLISTMQNAEELLKNDKSSNSYPDTIIVTDRIVTDFPIWVNESLNIIDWNNIDQETDVPLEQVNMTDTSCAYILHTSGSTGLPKGVVISHRNAITFINMAADIFVICDSDRLCNHAPLYFDLSVFDIFVAVKCGASIVMVPENLSVFPMRLAEYIAEKNISVWNSVASVLTLLAEKGKLGNISFDFLRLVIFSGEILPVKYLRKVKKDMPKAKFFNIYGQTEANSSTYYEIKEIPNDNTWKIPIGKAFPNFEVFIYDEIKGVIDHTGGEGELFVRSSTVALGYWNDKERTVEKFVADPREVDSSHLVYKTGDLVRIVDDGNLVFIGRKDNMIKSRGYRIELDEIEIVLNSHPSIKQAVVISIPEESIGNKLISFVSILEGENIDKRSIFSYCNSYLPKYMIPEEIMTVDLFPMTPNGKIDRNVLRKYIY